MSNSFKRLDAHLSSLGYCSRSEGIKFLKMFRVCVDEVRVFDPRLKIYHDQVTVDGEPLDAEVLTIIMHKPSGYICSHKEAGKLIYSLLPLRWQNRNPKVATIGRLDADTTGIILLTDDGALNHRLSSPKNEIMKIYEATLIAPVKGDEVEIFASGTLMLRGEKKPLSPAKLEILSSKHIRLEISEGRYHQVKRMFAAVDNKVLTLHRTRFGEYTLENLAEREYKIIS
ncbi:MAG: 16S rRNA pseudouridine(516) synthase [Sulfurimonadaceae bacterium]|jgi:16S rRNA pseudouridine516 synthase|nr:16S rRNA pseudouridine(516) synthase [Sulfurimonadaceae bacterium]